MVSEALWDAGGEVEGEWEGVFEVEGGGWVVSILFEKYVFTLGEGFGFFFFLFFGYLN